MRDILPIGLIALLGILLLGLIPPAFLPANVQTWHVEKRTWLGCLIIVATALLLAWNRRRSKTISQNQISD